MGIHTPFCPLSIVAQVYIFLQVPLTDTNMERNLEHILDGKTRLHFKSEGERRIAHFLDENAIRYQYEAGVLVHADDHKPRIWYPDFYLPEFGTYIEYYGLKGKRNYDSGIRRKDETYKRMSLDVIPVYPWTFAEDWKGYIMKEIKQSVTRRYEKLMSNPYWSRKGGVGYQRGSNRRY